jgi:hypothetical protein
VTGVDSDRVGLTDMVGGGGLDVVDMVWEGEEGREASSQVNDLSRLAWALGGRRVRDKTMAGSGGERGKRVGGVRSGRLNDFMKRSTPGERVATGGTGG